MAKRKKRAKENKVEFYFQSEDQQWEFRNRDEPIWAPHFRSSWVSNVGEISACRRGFTDKGLKFPKFPFWIVVTDTEPSDDLCLECERWDMDHCVYNFFRLRRSSDEFGSDEIKFWWWVEEEVEE